MGLIHMIHQQYRQKVVSLILPGGGLFQIESPVPSWLCWEKAPLLQLAFSLQPESLGMYTRIERGASRVTGEEYKVWVGSLPSSSLQNSLEPPHKQPPKHQPGVTFTAVDWEKRPGKCPHMGWSHGGRVGAGKPPGFPLSVQESRIHG